MLHRLAASLFAAAGAAVASQPQEGLYTIRNVNSGMYLDIESGSNDNSANVLVWNTPSASHSQWHLRITGSFNDYTLQNAQSGMYLSVPAVESHTDGLNVFVWESAELPESRWHFNLVSNGDGTAYSIDNHVNGRFLSVAGASNASGANVHLWSSPGKPESQWQLISEGTCHDAVPGDVCFNDTIWAKDYAINTRPEWYPGLTNESSFADFQAHLHHCYWARCPMPCASTSQHKCEMVGRFWSNATCQDAVEGEACANAVTWAMDTGIYSNPEWYPSLTEHSSFREFQARLFKGQQAGLESHSCSEPCCHDSLPGELCHEDAAWAQLYGINLPEFNDAYPPALTNESDFAEFQAYLHLCYPERCPVPCVSTEIMASQFDVSPDCPDPGHH